MVKKTKENKPPVSVITLSYNTKNVSLQCLKELKKSIDYFKHRVETILVENGTDGTADDVNKKYKWVKIIRPKKNTGFAKGNNLALQHINQDTKYVLFLNSDALVQPDTLSKSVEFFSKNKKCDVLGCRLKYGNGKFQPSAGYLPTPFSVFTWIWGLDLVPFVNKLLKQVHPKDNDFFSESKEVGWVMGAFLFMKKNVVRTTGGFDENFFLYMEEVEWCKRIKMAGFKIWYTPTFSIIHLDKSSSEKSEESMVKVFYGELMGLIFYLRKHYKKRLVTLRYLLKIGLLLRYLAFSILGESVRKTAYLKAFKDI